MWTGLHYSSMSRDDSRLWWPQYAPVTALFKLLLVLADCLRYFALSVCFHFVLIVFLFGSLRAGSRATASREPEREMGRGTFLPPPFPSHSSAGAANAKQTELYQLIKLNRRTCSGACSLQVFFLWPCFCTNGTRKIGTWTFNLFIYNA